jgi:predicted Fe-S protein YdhL (DUF1289 family)
LRTEARSVITGAMSLALPIASPCRQVCIIDGQSGLCLGCLRSLAEVASWSSMDAGERDAVMRALPGRRDLIDPARLARFPPY